MRLRLINLGAGLLLALFALPVLAQETPLDTAVGDPAIIENVSVSLVDRILEARDRLADVEVTARVVGSRSRPTISPRDVALAVVPDTSSSIEVVTIIQTDKKIKTVPSGWKVKLENSNGVNSRYRVEKNGTTTPYIVLAIRYPIVMDGKVENVIYTPYSPEIHTSEMVGYGQAYLEGVVQAALAELTDRDVKPLSYPQRSWYEIAEPLFLTSLAVTEHMDPAAVLRVDADPIRALERFFVLLAANREHTYGFSRSSAGALGMMQFIPGTYKGVRARFPKADLTTDFTKGMRDHVNAIKAAALLTDLNLNRVHEDKTGTLADDNERYAFLAASYNGGSTRVLRAVLKYSAAWEEDRLKSIAELQRQHTQVARNEANLRKQLKRATARDRIIIQRRLTSAVEEHKIVDAELASRKKTNLRRETITYVTKFRLIRAYLGDS